MGVVGGVASAGAAVAEKTLHSGAATRELVRHSLLQGSLGLVAPVTRDVQYPRANVCGCSDQVASRIAAGVSVRGQLGGTGRRLPGRVHDDIRLIGSKDLLHLQACVTYQARSDSVASRAVCANFVTLFSAGRS